MRRLCRHGHLLEAAVKTLRNVGLSWCSIENATFVALKKKFSSVISGGISRNFSSSFNPTHGSLMNLGIPNSETPKGFWCVYLSPSTMWIWLKGKYLIHLESAQNLFLPGGNVDHWLIRKPTVFLIPDQMVVVDWSLQWLKKSIIHISTYFF